jgi:hypothetical protein
MLAGAPAQARHSIAGALAAAHGDAGLLHGAPASPVAHQPLESHLSL